MSLANCAVGVMTGTSLAVSIIGQSLAQARGLLSKHAIKQVDRLLSNQGIVVWDMFAPWVAEVVGARKAIVVAMDWTDFDAGDQATLVLTAFSGRNRRSPTPPGDLDKRNAEMTLVHSLKNCAGHRPGNLVFSRRIIKYSDIAFADGIFPYLTSGKIRNAVAGPAKMGFPRPWRGLRT
jgi:hypothetical protein